MRPVLLLSLLLLAGCASALRVGRLERFAGHYRYGFEVESFEPCGSRERWWVTRSDDLRARVPADQPVEGRVFAVVRGRVSGPGLFGHLGGYGRTIEVVEILEVRPSGVASCPPFGLPRLTLGM